MDRAVMRITPPFALAMISAAAFGYFGAQAIWWCCA
jgi:hypothetical protein